VHIYFFFSSDESTKKKEKRFGYRIHNLTRLKKAGYKDNKEFSCSRHDFCDGDLKDIFSSACLEFGDQLVYGILGNYSLDAVVIDTM
jgi:hypothetical protein